MTERDPATLRRLARRNVVGLSLGAGVQSSTLYGMICSGWLAEQPNFDRTTMPTFATFADTQWEPKPVYAWLDKLDARMRAEPGYVPIWRVSRGSLRAAVFRGENATGQRFASIPWYTKTLDAPAGTMAPVYETDADGHRHKIGMAPLAEDKFRLGMGRRQCTREYKIDPIRVQTRAQMGYAKGQRVKHHAEIWIGISTDEATRAKPSLDTWQTSRWPLLELGFSRTKCLEWMAEHFAELGPPPKSACIGCPFHDDDHWIDMRDNDPESWAEAIEADKAIRRQPKFNSEQFAHRKCLPLNQVVLNPKDKTHSFDNECEGICGV